MSLAKNLKEARMVKNLTQDELAKLVGKTKNVISNWERGDNKPDADTIFELCDILDVDANYLLGWEDNQNISLSLKEQEHIKKYRSLDSYGKKAVDGLLDNEYERIQNQFEVSEEIAPFYMKTEYLTGLSAGTGLFVFDDIPTQLTAVPEEYKEADFVIGVTGNSMEPDFFEGDRVAVKKQNNVNVGEIGVFMIDGSGFLKKRGEQSLISLNPDYEDIPLNDDSSCIGKVIGKL